MRSLLIAVSLLHLVCLTLCTPQECVDLTGKNQLYCITSELLSKVSSTNMVVSTDGKAYIQDSALAAIVFAQTGHTDISKQICNRFLQLIESDGKLYSVYDPTTLAPANSIISSGDMAFSSLALARIHLVTGDSRYLTGATRILGYIQQNLKGNSDCYSASTDADPRSIEQNVVIYSAARFISIIEGVDEKFKAMMALAKTCLDTNKNVDYPSFDFMKQRATKQSAWYALALVDQESLQTVTKNSQYLGVEITRRPADINPELSASMAMALYMFGKDNNAFVKHALGATMKSNSAHNSAWALLMLLYTSGDKYANPFADNPANPAPVLPRDLPREQIPVASDQTTNFSHIGLIIGLVTSAVLFVVFAALLSGVLIARRTRRAKVPKPVKIRSKPNIKLIDMRAVGSPITPLNESNVYSPSTPSDAVSPYSPAYDRHEPYHIVSPGAVSGGEETKHVSPFI